MNRDINVVFSDDFVQSYEEPIYIKRKKFDGADEWELLYAFDSISENADIQSKEINFYSIKDPIKINKLASRQYEMSGYLTRSEQSQELIDIYEDGLDLDKDILYDIVKVFIYKPHDTEENVYACKYGKAKATVSRTSPDEKFQKYQLLLAIQGSLTDGLFKTTDPIGIYE